MTRVILGLLFAAACSSGGTSNDGGTNADTGTGNDASAGDASANDATSSDAATDAPGEASTKSCTNPVFTTSDPTGGQTFGAYYLYNDMWNTQATLGPQTLYVCDYDNWYAVSNQKDQQGAVLTYPNVHEDFPANTALSSFTSITSSFAETSPHVGIYEDAYDIWFDGFGQGHTELMIWVDNQKQVPSGAKEDTQTFSGHTYDVYRTSDGSYIALVATANFTSGTIDLLQVFQYIVGKTWLASTTKLTQIDFGVEIVDTAGAPATYTFTNFSITAN